MKKLLKGILFIFLLLNLSSVSAANIDDLSYQAYIQDQDWQKVVTNNNISGTVGEGKNLEAYKINLGEGSLRYSSYISTIGWEDWKNNNEVSGNTDKGLAIEAIKIELLGQEAEKFDIYYRVHVSELGWQDWAKNGQEAGSIGLGLPAQAFQIMLVNKDDISFASELKPLVTEISTVQTQSLEEEKPIKEISTDISYKAHCAEIGWQDFVKNSQTAGTVGESRQVEAINIQLPDSNIEYQTHVAEIGWTEKVTSGNISGTTGQGLGIQAIKLNLIGENSSANDIYYRTHVSGIGWLDWAKNGEVSGTEGLGRPIEAFEIIVQPKDKIAPGETELASLNRENLKQIIKVNANASVENLGWLDNNSNSNLIGTEGQGLGIEAIKLNIPNLAGQSGISYNLFIEDIGWQGDRSNNEIAGTEAQNLQAEAISIQLTGIVHELFDVYYQAHSSDVGWLGWAKNGEWAGTSEGNKKLEAVRIELVLKNEEAPGSTEEPYKELTMSNGLLTADQIPNFNLICAIVQHEGGANYQSALAVMSCVMNRCDSGRWGGTDPVSVLTAPGQFSSYLGGYYLQFINCPSVVVQQAVLDCLNGVRSHPYTSFRSYPTLGSVCIGGNWYF